MASHDCSVCGGKHEPKLRYLGMDICECPDMPNDVLFCFNDNEGWTIMNLTERMNEAIKKSEEMDSEWPLPDRAKDGPTMPPLPGVEAPDQRFIDAMKPYRDVAANEDRARRFHDIFCALLSSDGPDDGIIRRTNEEWANAIKECAFAYLAAEDAALKELEK